MTIFKYVLYDDINDITMMPCAVNQNSDINEWKHRNHIDNIKKQKNLSNKFQMA